MANKICFVTNKITLSGGAERVICTLASDFAARGIDTTIITQESTECGYPIHPEVKIVATKTVCRVPGLRLFKRCMLLRAELKRLKPDAAVSFMVDNNLILSLFALGLPFVRIGSDRIYPATIKGARRHLCRLIYPLMQGFVFQTKEAKACFSGRVFDRATVIMNPLVGDIPDRAAVVSNDIVTVGRLTKQKNHELLIRAFGEFSKEDPDFRLLIYGNGPERANLESKIAALGLQNRVMLMGTSKRVLQEISGAKMFVLTSDYEGMPNVLAEAMDIGIPCVSTDCLGGGAAALIRNEENGLLVPTGDVQKVADAMKRLAGNPDFANELGQEAKRIHDTLSVDVIAKQWLDYIDQVINAK